MSEDLIYEVRDGIGVLTFNRPESRNAMTFAMYEGLRRICAEMPTDGSVKALVVRGAGGKAFAAGTDMSQFRAFETEEDAWRYEETTDTVLTAVERCPVPTVAAITGACTGGGAGIAAACDIRVATPSLKFGFPIARTLGNCLSVANLARLAALMGAGRVKEMLLTARLIEAAEAQAMGLVSEVVDDADARGMELARTLAGHAPLTMRATKEGLRRLTTANRPDDRDLIAMCYMSRDFREGMEAFLGKRRPGWTGT
ncbi:enoyl-CoA hydratase [Roseitranquillus sediminis]|uniref:enoyl-CoA hydratase n=1 Tax=Roseitranquillus sediminis TaxID=2809051 RepID=UPI001D0C9799|nr:enoyl-CoA hydratase [Roseitranquillus sediminis]MBM9596467.1 enoyl-CoA hydratase/isomerase family protein [Roseitranquillus sediminis]